MGVPAGVDSAEGKGERGRFFIHQRACLHILLADVQVMKYMYHMQQS